MQRLEVSCAVLPLYVSLGVKGLNNIRPELGLRHRTWKTATI